METKIIKLEQKSCMDKVLQEAGRVIKAGGLVAFPTETVYGLGGDALNAKSARRIYEAKGRPSDNPLIVHICDLKDLEIIAADISQEVLHLAKVFWPGPLTMVLKKTDRVPWQTTGGLATVAVRMPSDPVALQFIRSAGGFVAAPSANLSGRPSPTSARYVVEDLSGKIDMILAGEESTIGLESTIIDMTVNPYVILRPGYITEEMLREVVGKVETDPALFQKEDTHPPKAPGMRYRHYAPKGELTIVIGQEEKVSEYICNEVEQEKERGRKTGVICAKESLYRYLAHSVKCLGSRTDQEEVARSLYRILREFDTEGIEVIFSEEFSGKGMGQAVWNRLLKAAGYRILHV